MELANSIVTLQPGMYILRHPKTGMPPISISRAAVRPEHSGHVQALFTPQTEGSVLRDGRDCIVMQVLSAPVDLLVTAYLKNSGAAVPALKIDKIRLDGEDVAVGNMLDVPRSGISVIGHIERLGDVLAKPGQRLGDASTDLRVEGFKVVWPDRPQGVDLEYSVKVEGTGDAPEVTTGTFCGTRNAARRIVGVMFRVVGEQAHRFSLTGNATFSGGYSAQLSGGSMASGPSGLEHLTSLEIGVGLAKGPARNGPWDASEKTRVFKSAKTASKNVHKKK